MSDINISAEVLKPRFDKQDELSDGIDRALQSVPQPVELGPAGDYIVTLFQTVLEGHRNLADTHRALIAVARDVLTDFAHNDAGGAQELRDLKTEIENPS